MGKTSRVKGASYERELAARFQEIGWEDAKRHLEFQSDEAEMGRDLENTEPFAVQAKCYKSTPSISAIDQITPDDQYPIRVALLKRTQSKGIPGLEVAVLDVDVFFRMIQLIEDWAEMYSMRPGNYDPWDWIAHGTVQSEEDQSA